MVRAVSSVCKPARRKEGAGGAAFNLGIPERVLVQYKVILGII
jgi:hypothetical protein